MSLILESIVKSFPDFRLDLGFSARKGELLTLLGPSGCGKTTSLRLIAGFIQPDSGSILIAGRPVDRLPPERRGIGIVFQDYALFPHLNVRDNIAFGLKMQGWPAAKRAGRVRALLQLVHLEGYGRRKVDRLSGGEQQRVALARALAPDPRLLLLDEPLSALDAKLRKALRQEIRRIQRELKLTTVYVTHDQEEALALSDRIAVMNEGRIEQVGTPREVYARPQTLFVATFVGQANLIEGRMKETRGPLALLQTPFGDLKARRPEVERENMVLFFRPESCELGAKRENHIRGRIVRCEYLGGYCQLGIEAGESQLTLNLQDTARFDLGEEIDFGFDPSDCRLFPTEGGKSFHLEAQKADP